MSFQRKKKKKKPVPGTSSESLSTSEEYFYIYFFLSILFYSSYVKYKYEDTKINVAMVFLNIFNQNQFIMTLQYKISSITII